MEFNFGKLASSNFSSNAGAYLKPYDIYTVNLTKIEKTEIKGSKDPNAVYPVVSIEFTQTETPKGTFSTNLFIPSTEKYFERPKFEGSNGHEYERPSRFENFQYTLMQIVHALNPAGEEKIKANSSKIQTIDQFIDLIIKALNGKNNVQTNLKLVGRNNGGTVYATLPNACGLKDGEIFPINFIGDNLFFTNYELNQQKEYKNARPTQMNDNNEIDSNKNDEEFDLDNIEL